MIRVICVDISGLDDVGYGKLYDKASPERKSRVDRYRSHEDAVRCVTADALLRYALGTEQYDVAQTADGKPYIPNKSDFYHNLSHSGCWVVLAYGDSELGVDVEKIRPNINTENISNRFFSEEEQRYIREDPTQSRCRFFEVWTGKESYVKYLGTGLKTDLKSFSIFSLPPEVRLHHRKLDENYCLSLCVSSVDYLFERLELQQML